jgi:hypothetical protein
MDRRTGARYAAAHRGGSHLHHAPGGIMRPLLYLSSLALALPGVVLAAAFLLLGHAIAARSFLGFFGVLVDAFVWLFPWGLLVGMVVLLALVIAGVTARFRWLASVCVAALAIGSSVVVLSLDAMHGNFSPGQLTFFIPALMSATASLWLATSEWPRRATARGRV